MSRFRLQLSKVSSFVGIAFIFGSLVLPIAAFAQSGSDATPPVTTVTSPADAPTTEAVDTAGQTARPFVPLVPNPSVPIPGVRFTAATEENGIITVPYLSQYISGIYRLSVGLGAILAAVMIVFGGFKYLLAASVPDVKDGKTIIQDAVIGLVVLLSSFLILKTINPQLVESNPIRIQRFVEQAPLVQGESFTGLPNETGVESFSQPGQCGGGASRQVTMSGVTFTQLAMRGNYRQGQAPWGALEYGPGLTTNSPQNPCQHQNSSDSCYTTLAAAACGPTAFAEVMAYYGVRVTDPGSAQIAQNAKIWSGSSLVNLSASSRGQAIITALQQRVQSHLYDPLDAAKKAVAEHSRGHNTGTGWRFMNWPGYDATRITGRHRSQTVATEIRAGHPVVFLCAHCKMKSSSITGEDHYGGDHYMVIDGVSQDGNWFHIAGDGGGGNAGGRFISAEELDTGKASVSTSDRRVVAGTLRGTPVPGRSDRVFVDAPSVDLLVIKPQAGTAAQPCATSNDGPANGGAAGGATNSGAAAATGAVSRNGFTYRPSAGTSVGWTEQSQLLFPTRLLEAFRAGQHPRIHLYIFAHGINDAGHDIAYVTSESHPDSSLNQVKRALEQVAGTQNIVVAMPHNMDTQISNYMSGFNLQEFYTTALAAMRTSIPGSAATDIQDIVIGGHSAATCNGPGNPLLKQAIGFAPGPRLLGIAAYDGCMGDSAFNASSFQTPAGVALLMNPDLKGMGHEGEPDRYQRVRTSWELRRIACPSTVTNACPMDSAPADVSGPDYNQRRCNACYGRTVDGKQIVSFETTYGHKPSIGPMTQNVFNAFYAN